MFRTNNKSFVSKSNHIRLLDEHRSSIAFNNFHNYFLNNNQQKDTYLVHNPIDYVMCLVLSRKEDNGSRVTYLV